MDAFLQRVADLSGTEHKEVFNIISQCKSVRYMQNSNGTFIDMSTIPDDVLEAVRRFVDYCHHNKGMLEDYNNRLAECRMNQDFERLPRRSSSAKGAAAPPATTTDTKSSESKSNTNAASYVVHNQDDDEEEPDEADDDNEEPDNDNDNDDDDEDASSIVTATAGSGAGRSTTTSPGVPPSVSAMTLSSVTRRMTTSKFNQAKKRITRKRVSSGPASRSNEMSGFLVPERYVMHSPVAPTLSGLGRTI